MPLYVGQCSNGHLFGYNTMPEGCPQCVNGKECDGKLSPLKAEKPKTRKSKKVSKR